MNHYIVNYVSYGIKTDGMTIKVIWEALKFFVGRDLTLKKRVRDSVLVA
jgi:hypothetical protein